ncbi:MAG: molybdopterin-dependent oxidoreductase [Pseudomonadales bacterium]|nr:molybdopterin-dependent oxidoreductase [Pseudomonadales bacterium]
MQRRNFFGLLGGAGWILPAFSAAQTNAVPTDAVRTLQDLLPEKDPLRLLNDRPINAETPAHLLDDATTPTKRLFVRNNGHPPELTNNANGYEEWRFEVGGEACVNPQSLSVSGLKKLFKTYSYDLQLECGGNGRAEFRPRASGNQWSTGAIGCPRWTGVRLREVLEYCGVKGDAQYVAYRGADRHLSGNRDTEVISRGVPLRKALEDESLLAFELNGEPIPLMHGGPMRMVCGGWPGSVSGKWITEILLRNQVHDGAKMGGKSYRLPCESVAPGTSVADADMCIIESMPVKSLITYPRSGINVQVGSKQVIRGQAWAGDLKVDAMAISLDFGATWQPAELAAPVNRLAWQQWHSEIRLPKSGYYELWARATDELGRSQPMLVPGWNPKGYLNNASHRIALHGV